MKLLRSVASVLLSSIVVYGVVVVSYFVLTYFFPDQYAAGEGSAPFLLWISTGMFAVASIFAGWLCVRLAPFRQSGHLFVLFLLGELAGAYLAWQRWGQDWPQWHLLVALAVWPVCLWLGGLRRRGAPPPRFVARVLPHG